MTFSVQDGAIGVIEANLESQLFRCATAGVDGYFDIARHRRQNLIANSRLMLWSSPVRFMAFKDLFLLGIEILVTSAFLLSLFRLRHKLGLVPFYMALGAMQQLQTTL